MPILPTYHAFAPALDPRAGDLLMRGTSVQEGSPALERVLLALRTQRGDCPLDPTLGVDWNAVETAFASSAAPVATAQAEIRAALLRYVADGSIADLTVEAQVSGSALFYEVTFVDVRARAKVTTGQQTRGVA